VRVFEVGAQIIIFFNTLKKMYSQSLTKNFVISIAQAVTQSFDWTIKMLCGAPIWPRQPKWSEGWSTNVFMTFEWALILKSLGRADLEWQMSGKVCVCECVCVCVCVYVCICPWVDLWALCSYRFWYTICIHSSMCVMAFLYRQAVLYNMHFIHVNMTILLVLQLCFVFW